MAHPEEIATLLHIHEKAREHGNLPNITAAAYNRLRQIDAKIDQKEFNEPGDEPEPEPEAEPRDTNLTADDPSPTGFHVPEGVPAPKE